VLNDERRVNGDPARPVPLTELGREEARRLGLQIMALELDLCLHTRFGRTRETAEIAMAGRDVPVQVEPLLDDVDVGALEGRTVDEYRAWKREHTRNDAFPGGESLNDAARRYAEAFRRLARSDRGCLIAVCHEIPIRYALNALADSDELDGPTHGIPNATPFLFGDEALFCAAERIEELVRLS